MTQPEHILDGSAKALAFSHSSPQAIAAAVDQILHALPPTIEILALGEALHGDTQILDLRNLIFQNLATDHGYTAIAIESSFPRAHLANEFVMGRGPAQFDDLADAAFSHGFGKLDPNRKLIHWMREHNASLPDANKLRFYGFDSPTEMTGTDSPRQLLRFALDYLQSLDPTSGNARRDRIEERLGSDADWENPAAMMDPTKSVGLSPAAGALRLETEELINELRRRRPDLVAASDSDRYLEALQHAFVARHMLNYHAGLARASDNRIAELLGVRDLVMADNLVYAADRERRRGGKLFAFAHNSHLKYGQAKWQLGPHALAWWPAGAHLHQILADRYVVIGHGVGKNPEQGISPPEQGSLESALSAGPGKASFLVTQRGRVKPGFDLTTRSGSKTNSTYFPLTPQSLEEYDVLIILN